MTETRSFLGMNIVGAFDNGRPQRAVQRPASELAQYFEAVFEGGVIDGVRWVQYTPYFNDGDPCEFSINADMLMVRLAEHKPTAEEAIEMEGGAEYGSASDFQEGWIETYSYSESDPIQRLVGQAVYPEGVSRYRFEGVPEYVGPHPSVLRAIDELKSALGSGAFDDAVLGLFGDHATITVPAKGDIEVESYEHD